MKASRPTQLVTVLLQFVAGENGGEGGGEDGGDNLIRNTMLKLGQFSS